MRTQRRGKNYQEKAVHKYIKWERRERVARVVIIPHADLDGYYDGRIQEQYSAADKLSCEVKETIRFFSSIKKANEDAVDP